MLLQEMTWRDVEQLSKNTPVVIPIAAIEQHGHHLPLFTDSMLLGEIVGRVQQSVAERSLIAPLMWLGNSHHHLDFAGTLSCEPRCYLDLVAGLIENFITHGFLRILVLNGHGGNDVPGKQAAFEIRQKFRTRSDLLLLFSTYWSIGSLSQPPSLGFKQSEMGHACEWETSMMLRIAPQLVGNYRSADTVEPGNAFRPASRAWITKDRSGPGHIGCPQKATAEKGEYLLAEFTRNVVEMIERMIIWDGRRWEG